MQASNDGAVQIAPGKKSHLGKILRLAHSLAAIGIGHRMVGYACC